MQMLDKVTECDVTKSHNRRRDYWRGVSGAVFSDRERSFRWWSLLTFLTLKSPPRSPFNWEKCSIWNFPFFWLLKFHKPNLSPPQFMKLKNKSAEPICSSTQRTLFFFFFFLFFGWGTAVWTDKGGNLAFVCLSSVALMRIPHTGSILTGCFKA